MTGRRFSREISAEDTFESVDLLGRRPLADSMTNLVLNSSDSLVVALDDEWGSGKTFFLRLWQNSLKNQGIPVVYFNAFESDFSGDAFLSLTGCLLDHSDRQRSLAGKSRKRFVQKSALLAKTLGRSAVNIAIKAGTAGVIDAADAGDAISAAISETGSEGIKHIEELIERKAAERRRLDEFRDAISTYRTAAQKGDEYPLVFIVDELDRCRPEFAFDVLECLKHFFNAPKTHFVLGINLDALGKSVSAVYGGSYNGERYLSRFIDYRLSFVPDRYSTRLSELKTYAGHLWKTSDTFSSHHDVRDGLVDIIAIVVDAKGGTFRDIEKVMAILHLCLAVVTEQTFRSPPIIGGLVLMRYFDRTLFQKALQNQIKYSEVAKFFQFKESLEEYGEKDERAKMWMQEWWSSVLGGPISEEEKRQILRSMIKYNFLDTDRIVEVSARNIVERFWQPTG